MKSPGDTIKAGDKPSITFCQLSDRGKISFVFLLCFRALIPSPALSPVHPPAPRLPWGCLCWSLGDVCHLRKGDLS